MSVYVDNMRAPFRRMIMCHMLADTHEELVAMAKAIGVNVRWIQYAGTYKEHFDICLEKRALAVAAGAVEIDMRETANMLRTRRWAVHDRLIAAASSELNIDPE